MFKVFATETYSKEISKWNSRERNFAEKVTKQLAKNTFVGKPISFSFLREKKLRKTNLLLKILIWWLFILVPD